MAISELLGDVSNALKDNPITQFIEDNPLKATALVAGAAVGATALTAGIIATKRKKRTRKKSVKRSKRSRHKKKARRRYTPHTAGKGKDRSTKRIRFTKNGQPYVIMRSGKARFIKRSSAKRSRRIKGGRY